MLGQLAARISTANESTIRNFNTHYLKSLAANPELLNMRDGVVPVKNGSARGIIMRKASQLLVERGGSKKITPAWAKSLLGRVKFGSSKGTKKAKKHLEMDLQWDANSTT